MFAELIFVVSSVLGLLVIDNFSTSFALITCGLTVYCYAYHYSHVLNKDIFVIFLISKIWGGLTFCFRIGKRIYSIFKKIFSSEKSSVLSSPKSISIQHCGKEKNLDYEINVIVLKISQHYIQSWYSKISENEEFVVYLNTYIKDSFLSLSSRVTKVDTKKLSYVILQIYLHFFSHFLDIKKKSEKLKFENFEMKHWAMKDSLTEWCYLQSLVTSLLDTFGSTESDNSLHSKCSPLLNTVVVEILTENVINPLVNVLTDPSRLNLWLMKLILNYMKKNELSHISPVKDCLKRYSISYPEDYDSLKPKILLPSEDSFVKYVDDKEEESECQNMLTVPGKSAYTSQTEPPGTEYPITKFCNEEASDDFPCFVASGVKSTSNINLLDDVFSCVSASKSTSTSPTSCDTTTIKRSKSADFIRQMTQLKALNEKDYNITLQSKNNKMLVALKSDVNSSNFVEQAEEAIEVEVPTLFTDVKITDTLQQIEAGLLPYTLYCIQYSGVFHDTGNCSDTPQFVKQVVNIRRRFREFLALQSRLEDNPSLKNSLKGIKGPSKWLALPFSNLDKKNIAERKSFLESYLKELCSQGPITQSSELQEFLAYGGDARIAFVKKAADINVPRIDKMLVRGVKGAIDMFRTALPNSPVEGGCSGENTPIPVKSSFEDINHDHRFQEHLLDYSSREPEIKEHVRNYFQNFLENPSFDCVMEDSNDSDSNSKKTSLLRHVHNFNVEECCKCSGTWSAKDNFFMLEENLFGNVIFELVGETFKSSQVNVGQLLSIIKLLGAPCIDRYFVNKLDGISDELLTVSLHMLHKVLWPDETNAEETNPGLEGQITVNRIMDYVEVLLSSNYVIKNMSYTLRKTLLEKIYLFLSSIQHQELNRCLLFHLFDVILETLCSKEK